MKIRFWEDRGVGGWLAQIFALFVSEVVCLNAVAAVPAQTVGYLMYNAEPIQISGSYEYTEDVATAWAIQFAGGGGVSVVEATAWQPLQDGGREFQVCTYNPANHPSVPHCGSGPWGFGGFWTFCKYGSLNTGCAWVSRFPWRPKAVCPVNSFAQNGSCLCKPGFQEDALQKKCVRAVPELAVGGTAGMCTPNPISPVTAEKFRSEVDTIDSGPASLLFSRTYRSTWGADAARAVGSLGKAWSHNHVATLVVSSSVDAETVSIFDPEGSLRTFYKVSDSVGWIATNSTDSLMRNSDGSWIHRRADNDTALRFNADGKLQLVTPRSGRAVAYTYNAAGQLSTISNGFGRILTLGYNTVGQLVTVTTPDLRVVAYAYDTLGRLSSVTYPDGKSRGFLYENTSFPHALTGLLDETGARFAIFAYDSQGRAIDSALAGSVDRYQVSYPSTTTASILDPLGTARTYSYSTTKGKLAVTGGSLPSGLGEADASSRVQDANGLITSETDFKGVVTTTTWDTARRLPLTVTRASGRPEAQTTTTQWHPTFSLQIGRAVQQECRDRSRMPSSA
eukprot:TRINITY_DN1069_c0_g1_i2.p1 TRINITY_DN1069_c0_g1~~TRINITY_DN1069_c0_g1_i2.p1  ORF type:complete len:564 (+),score=66.83 TRINITY_DN1069_c0_g1_i2:671-2362(+)